MRQLTAKIYVQHISMQTLSENGFELRDEKNPEDEFTEKSQENYYLSVLTNRQKSVANLLNYGHSRKEIAKELNVCLQAIHQIVLRIRKRLRDRTNIAYQTKRSKNQETEDTRNLLFMFYLTVPNARAEQIHRVWEIHNIFREYDKPTLKQIKQWLKEFNNGEI